MKNEWSLLLGQGNATVSTLSDSEVLSKTLYLLRIWGGTTHGVSPLVGQGQPVTLFTSHPNWRGCLVLGFRISLGIYFLYEVCLAILKRNLLTGGTSVLYFTVGTLSWKFNLASINSSLFIIAHRAIYCLNNCFSI